MDTGALQVVRTLVEPCRVKLAVDVPVETVRATFDKNLAEFRKFGRVPGFRAGKSPRELLLRHYGKRIREETEKEVIRQATQRAVEQEKLRPETTPRLEKATGVEFHEDAAFAFAVTFDVAPEFPLPSYRGLKIAATAAPVDDALVEKTIAEWLQRRTSYHAVERPAQADDMLKVAWSAKLDGDAALPESAKFFLENPDGWLPLRQPEIIPGALAAVTGRKAGDEVTFQAEFPEDYFEKALAGKSAAYTMRILEVQAPQVPELTDDLAKEMGHQTQAEMRGAVRDYLHAQENRRQRDALRQQALAALLQVPEFPVPPSAIARETVEEFVQLYNQALRGGRKEAELQGEQEKMMAEARTRAQQKLRRHYVLRAVADAEKIEVSQEEFTAAVASLAQMQRMTPKALLRRLEENGRLADLHDQIRETKTLDHVLTLNQGDAAPAAAQG